MNILSINTFFPCPPRRGMDVVYLNLLKVQAAAHAVTVVTVCRSAREADGVDELARHCSALHVVTPRNVTSLAHKAYYRLLYSILSVVLWRPRCAFYGAPRELRDLVRRLLAQGHYDVVEVHHSTSATLRDCFPHHPAVLYLYDLHFRARARLAGTRRGIARVAARLQQSMFRHFESRVMRKYDLLLFGQDEDLAAAASLGIPAGRLALMPNVIDTDQSAPSEVESRTENAVVFVGAMTHHANIDAITHFQRVVWPLVRAKVSDAQWWIVGASPTEEIKRLSGCDGIHVFADVPDVRPYIHNASVYIAPLRIGSGVKVKIMEALSLGKAIVATGTAAEGMGLAPDHDLVVADLDQPFADAVASLLADNARRSHLGMNARDAACRLYSFNAGRATLGHAYNQLITSSSMKSH